MINIYNMELHNAATRGYIDKVRELINNGIDINKQDEHGWTALHYASWNGHLEIVQLLVTSGSDLNIQSPSGKTSLHMASKYGHLEIVKLLIGAGANINKKDNYDRTALHSASQKGHLEIVQFLIDAGVELDQYTIENHVHQLGQEIVDNINMTKQWETIQYLPQELQQQFPEPIVRASQLGMYD